MVERRFAIIGHRAPSNGKLVLNDLSGSSGRMDVLMRAINSALFLSHGIRLDSHITIHLMGGEGPSRRIWFDGSKVWGLHPDERALAGQIAKIIDEPTPARGHWIELHPGIWHSGGDISTTIQEWNKEDVSVIKLDANAPLLWADGSSDNPSKLGFIISDDLPFSSEEEDTLKENTLPRSLGEKWIQGHIAIGIVHHLLDNSISLNLN
ncbi:MAG: hypothetical protein HOE69_07950 [Euryarchaeota archaeon]|nr:hypothetical protein [Euryarchaeota archaeon]